MSSNVCFLLSSGGLAVDPVGIAAAASRSLSGGAGGKTRNWTEWILNEDNWYINPDKGTPELCGNASGARYRVTNRIYFTFFSILSVLERSEVVIDYVLVYLKVLIRR